MKKVISYFAWIIAAVVMIPAAYFCHFYYTLYHRNVTELESRINYFDVRLAKLESHKSRELTPVHVWGVISTSDNPADDYLRGYLPSEKLPDGYLEVVEGKGGPVIVPEIRLLANSSSTNVFEIHIKGRFGTVADAWLSHAEPYQNLAALEQFSVYCPNGTNIVKLTVEAKPNASIKLRFDLVILCER